MKLVLLVATIFALTLRAEAQSYCAGTNCDPTSSNDLFEGYSENITLGAMFATNFSIGQGWFDDEQQQCFQSCMAVAAEGETDCSEAGRQLVEQGVDPGQANGYVGIRIEHTMDEYHRCLGITGLERCLN